MLYVSSVDVVVQVGETIIGVAEQMIIGTSVTYVVSNAYTPAETIIEFTGSMDDLRTLHLRYCANDLESAEFFNSMILPV